MYNSRGGEYSLTGNPNYYVSSDKKFAIWYDPEEKNWGIGTMNNLGTHKKAIATNENDNTAADKCPNEMGNSWSYLKNGKFVKTRKNIKVQCSKKGKKYLKLQYILYFTSWYNA